MDVQRFCYINLLLFGTNGIVLSLLQSLNSPGYTVPSGTIMIEYGNPLDIMCVLYNITTLPPNASRFLSFVRNEEMILSDMIEIVNSSAIKLHIEKPPKTQVDLYTCTSNRTAVAINLVTVGTKPQPVTDFNCISYNYDNLTCTWTAPQNYAHTTYSLKYMIGGRSSRYALSCPRMERLEPDGPNQRMRCVWTSSSIPPYRQVHRDFFFTLEMSNHFGTNQLNKTFAHFAHVLSGPPENLTVMSATSSSLYLSWTVPWSMQTFPPGVHHRIFYRCEYDGNEWRFGEEISDAKARKGATFNLTDLRHAHALCDIRVSLRSASAAPEDESMWSQNASITGRTSSKIPDAPPRTDVGSFDLVTIDKNIYEAVIYWEQLEEEKNGPNFLYKIRAEDDPSLRPIKLTNTYAKFKNLSVSKSYTISIWSENDVGASPAKSTVFIPKQIDRIRRPSNFMKVESAGGNVELTWKAPVPPSGQHVTNYTIFWCIKKDIPFQCRAKLNWTVVPNDTTQYTGSFPKNKAFQFAIAANTESGSSGMLWAARRFVRKKNIAKMEHVRVNRVGTTFVEVGWSANRGNIDGFVIYHCPIVAKRKCRDHQKRATFAGDGTVSAGNITDLSPNTTYKLTVAAIIDQSIINQPSDPLYSTTL